MLKLVSAAATDPGRERGDNQDQAWAQIYQPSDGEPVGLFLVCDGVGGHQGGQYASHWAVEAIKSEFDDLFCPGDPRQTVVLSKDLLEQESTAESKTVLSGTRQLEEMVRQAILKANDVVYEFAQQKPDVAGDAGTTITMAVVVGNRAIIANVGDSRTYILRDRQIRQVTHDHSLVASLVASGQLKPEEVFSHPKRNLIFRSLGQKDEITVDTFVEFLVAGDHLLLCSDGLWEMVQDESNIARLIEEAATPQEACEKLVAAANSAGGTDNIGVVVVAIQ